MRLGVNNIYFYRLEQIFGRKVKRKWRTEPLSPPGPNGDTKVRGHVKTDKKDGRLIPPGKIWMKENYAQKKIGEIRYM